MKNFIQDTYQSFMKMYFLVIKASGRIEIDEILHGLQQEKSPVIVGRRQGDELDQDNNYITAVHSQDKVFVLNRLPASCMNTLVKYGSFLPMQIHQGGRIVSFQARYRETLLAEYAQDYMFEFPTDIDINYSRSAMRFVLDEAKAVRLSLSAVKNRTVNGLVNDISRSGICLSLGNISAEYFSLLKTMVGQKVTCDFQLDNEEMPCQIEITSVRASSDDDSDVFGADASTGESVEGRGAQVAGVLLAQNEKQERLLEKYLNVLEYSKMMNSPAL